MEADPLAYSRIVPTSNLVLWLEKIMFIKVEFYAMYGIKFGLIRITGKGNLV